MKTGPEGSRWEFGQPVEIRGFGLQVGSRMYLRQQLHLEPDSPMPRLFFFTIVFPSAPNLAVHLAPSPRSPPVRGRTQTVPTGRLIRHPTHRCRSGKPFRGWSGRPSFGGCAARVARVSRRGFWVRQSGVLFSPGFVTLVTFEAAPRGGSRPA